MQPIDILGLGVVAVDDLLFVDGYPPPDAKTMVLRRERHCGGLTATALVAATRLGARCAYAGVLDGDGLSEFAIQVMRREGIDLAHLRRIHTAPPAYSTIVIDATRQTRNIFVDLNDVVGAAPDWPSAEVIQACRVLFVDFLGLAGMLRAANLARAAGIPIVADIESTAPEVSRLMDTVDHLILSWDFARQITSASTPEEAALALWRDQRQVVVVTHGDRGCWYVAARDPSRAVHQPAFRVAVIDKTPPVAGMCFTARMQLRWCAAWRSVSECVWLRRRRASRPPGRAARPEPRRWQKSKNSSRRRAYDCEHPAT